MTDQEWKDLREKTCRKEGVDPASGLDYMMPYPGTKGHGWVSRAYVEGWTAYCNRPEFRASVAKALRFLRSAPR